MIARILFAAAGLLVSTSAGAQAASEQTTEDLVCQLSDKCVEAEASPTEATADKPASRVSATRGFKISRKTEAPATNSGYTAPKSGTGKAQPRVAYEGGKKASPAKAKTLQSANAKALPKGRADLALP